MQENHEHIAVNLEWLAQLASLHAARGNAGAEALAGSIRELQKMSQSALANEFKLNDVDDAAVRLETRLTSFRRQQQMIAAIAERLDAEADQCRRALELADGHDGVSALCEHQDDATRELVAEMAQRHQRLQQQLQLDREQIDVAAERCRLRLQSGSYADDEGTFVENKQNSLDHGDGEMF